ncbi:cell envelope biogenesis protein LolA [Brevirhabdus pacifica]|uniref:Cell envelope biogenesis protein LolA n=1 Tax=Brevirhabdus pacifica TaxID=1267768 RepID=A0A1U7DIK5_9RHOB|nr:outer membrane lipoprotein carrier protein LolA [Brevirhabdus pacifica]APX89729.1 cell envelope biogenesis protein LolA [Brevirhabdus pacifica]OWU74567.1 cell envelope biogenesis protein LolA [Loktanella sp. 22II-4b]PJJ85580.1 outer membrane lipoprotein-sorting protein [Brevirhabdus pacifica]
MNTRRSFLLGAAGLLAAGPAFAAKIPLGEISGYLNTIKNASGKFTQINPDGSMTTGKLYIQRPGRMRFEYDPPDRSLVIAGGGKVAVFDPKSNTPPDQFPLSRTPLKIILEKNVNLGRSGMVIGHSADAKSTTVVAQDPQHPEYGNIRLVFTGSPVELRQWVVTDDSGQKTTVILNSLKNGASVGARLFNIPQEIQARGLN